MAQNRVDNIQVNAPKDIDNKKGVWESGTWRPYNSISEAIATVKIGARYRTQPVVIFKGSIPTDYWWRDGIADNQLIEKTTSGSTYTLPIATASTLGGVKVGDGLYIDEETGSLGVTGGGGGGSGSVTSVTMTSTDLNVTGSPITSSGTLVANIKNSAVTFAKMQSVPQGVLVGRGSTGTGTLGNVTIGSGLELNTSNVLSATGGGGGGSQTLQQTLNLGRIGDRMQITESLQIPVVAPSVIESGNIWVGSGTSGGGGGGGGYTLPIASASILGGIKIGTGLTVDPATGIVSSSGSGYTLPIATATDLGGIKIGSGLTINATTGVVSTTGGGGGGSVSSVGMTTPTGLTVAGSPITSSGTLALTFTSGYSIPLNSAQTNWSSAYTHSQTVGNPHGTTLQQILTEGRVGDSMQITASMQIPTSAPSSINAGNVWVGTGTTVGSVVKSKVVGVGENTATTLGITSAQASSFIVATNSSAISATISSGVALTSVFVRQGGSGKVTFNASGVTILVKSTKQARTEGQNSVVEIFYETATRVVITGDLDNI